MSITGAAGNISYALLFRIAAGDMLGKDQPVALQLLEITPAMQALEGVVMELDDCAFPLLSSVDISDDPGAAFRDSNIAMLVGSKPRGPDMQRSDLIKDNGAIFSLQGKALNDNANRDVKVIVVGNPANTNAFIAAKNAPDLNPGNFTAMMRLDHNRALSQLSAKLNLHHTEIGKMIIWGNHSATQYPDITNVVSNGVRISDQVDQDWLVNEFIPTVQNRGTAIIRARGASSAASAASAAIDHMRDWVLGTPEGDWVSMAIPSDGSYGIQEGLMYSFPVTCSGGNYHIVQDLDISDFSRELMTATEQELKTEVESVRHLI